MTKGCWAARGCWVWTLVGEVLQPPRGGWEGPGGTLALLRRCHAGDNHACIQRQNTRGESSCRRQGQGGELSHNPQSSIPTMVTTPESFPSPLASQGCRACLTGGAGKAGKVSQRGLFPACSGRPLTCPLADDFCNGGGEVADPVGAFLSVVDVSLPSTIWMLLQDLPWDKRDGAGTQGHVGAGGWGAESSLTVMTSPARTLRAVGSWRFQKSFKARTFRIPDASEGKGQRKKEGARAQGGKRGVQGGQKEKARARRGEKKTLILQKDLNPRHSPTCRMGAHVRGDWDADTDLGCSGGALGAQAGPRGKKSLSVPSPPHLSVAA